MMTYKIIAISILLFFFNSSCLRKGCTDPYSLSYNENTSIGDYSCTYPDTIKRALMFRTTSNSLSPDWPSTNLHYSWMDYFVNQYPLLDLINIHYDGDLQTSFGDSIVKFLYGNCMYTSTSSYYSYDWFIGTQSMFNLQNPLNQNTIISEINSEINNEVQIAIDLDYEIVNQASNDVMEISVQLQKINTYNSSSCNLAVYILEDNIIAPITNSSAPISSFEFNNVLRAVATRKRPWGTDNFDNCDRGFMGIEISFDDNKALVKFSHPLKNNWNFSNCYPTAVIWRDEGNSVSIESFEYVNSLSGKN